MTSTDISYINLYISSNDNLLDISYSQYMLNYLANIYPTITNRFYYDYDNSYIIYNYNDPSILVSDTKIYIDSSYIDVRYAQYLNNWKSGRDSSDNYNFFSNSLSIFNGQEYWCRPYISYTHVTKINNETVSFSITGNLHNSHFNIPIQEISSVIVGSSVTTLEPSCFMGCSNLKNIFLPNSIVSIGDSAFKNCYSLQSITIPTSVTSIDYNIFMIDNSLNPVLSSITLLCSINNLIRYHNKMFANIYSDTVTVYHLPQDLEGDRWTGIFSYSNINTRINIPITSITHTNNNIYGIHIVGEINNTYYLSMGILSSDISSIILGQEVTSIGYEAFKDHNNLSSIDLNNVTHIGEKAFMNCSILESIIIPSSVTHIGEKAFMNCSILESIIIPASVTHIGADILRNDNSLNSISFYGSLNMTNVNLDAFKGLNYNTLTIYHSYLNWLNIENDLSGYMVVDDISFLHLVSIIDINHVVYDLNTNGQLYPDIYSTLGLSVGDISSVIVGNSVTRIENETFKDNINLSSILLPNTITNIGARAFMNCNLQSITIPTSISRIEADSFKDNKNLSSILLPNTITNIEARAFMNCNLQSITIPSSISFVGHNAFRNNYNLNTITFENNMNNTSSAANAFDRIGATEQNLTINYYSNIWPYQDLYNYVDTVIGDSEVITINDLA